MNAGKWIHHFEINRHAWIEPDWGEPCRIGDPGRRKLLARSLATFQLGETGGGSRLMRSVGQTGKRDEESLKDYCRAVTLFIEEEQYHAEILARMVKYLGGRLRRRHWANSIFRGTRNLFGLEFNLQVLLTAELIAEGYYGMLSRHVDDPVIRDSARKILKDEVGHIAFHRDFFRRRQADRLPVFTASWSLQFQMLFMIAAAVVWLDHGRCLKAFGVSRKRFLRRCSRCCRSFLRGVSGASTGSGLRMIAADNELPGHK